MTLEIQKFLRNGGTPEQLKAQYAIKTAVEGPLVLFKYDQIASPMGERICQEARGLILDSEDNWNVVSMGFTKFFNHGEPNAAEIDWSTATVQGKIDGSLLTVFFYGNRWHVQTTGTIFASGQVNGLDMTFKDLFWKTWEEEGYPNPVSFFDRDFCFMFELTTPFNRVVVPHKTCRLTLLAIKNKLTLQEVSIKPIILESNIQGVRSFALQSMDEVIESFQTIDPLYNEGYVVVDAQFNRVKVKHPGYLALHRLKGEGVSPTPKRILELVRMGEQSEILTYFPEWTESFRAIESKYNTLVVDLLADYERIKDLPDQKSFALEAVKTRCSGALFACRRGTPIRQFLADIQIKNVLEMLKVADED